MQKDTLIKPVFKYRFVRRTRILTVEEGYLCQRRWTVLGPEYYFSKDTEQYNYHCSLSKDEKVVFRNIFYLEKMDNELAKKVVSEHFGVPVESIKVVDPGATVRTQNDIDKDKSTRVLLSELRTLVKATGRIHMQDALDEAISAYDEKVFQEIKQAV